MKGYKLTIKGVVQGVGFRPTVFRIANDMRLKGYVRNAGAYVEIFVDRNVKKFIENLKKNLPPLARIDSIEIELIEMDAKEFTIVRSTSSGGKDTTIPPDTAICHECLEEIFDENSRRYLYPFTNCTSCGARYSVIKRLPYDRKNTSMSPFRMCNKCREEYGDPTNRRFHAQTISCKSDGPMLTLYNSYGEKVNCTNPMKKFAEMIDQGYIGAMKGWGGMHIVCLPTEIPVLRKKFRRPSKPYAIMVKDVEVVKKYAYIDSHEKKILTSPSRPILLLIKKNTLLEDAAPGLNSVGIYLPYSPIHYILFRYLDSDAIVMTSANVPGEPMITENDKIFELSLDCYLLHNRKIIFRVDDSVLIARNEREFFIRRSRGYAPSVFPIQSDSDKALISVGAEENVTVCVSHKKRIVMSQYIGDSRHYGVQKFIEKTVENLLNLLGVKKVDGVCVDMHPQYSTRIIGRKFRDMHRCEMIEIQHHWSHGASLLLENNMDDIVVLAADGAGYGSDMTIWGCEVLYASKENFTRIGSISKFPLIGGDAAVKDPKRIVYSLLKCAGKDYEIENEDIMRNLMKKSPLCSSMGRFLDAISYLLGVCKKWTYDGEPAMRLEKYLDLGDKSDKINKKYEFEIESYKDGSIIRVDVISAFNQLKEYWEESDKSDIFKANAAYVCVESIMRELVKIACDFCEKYDISHVGFTGGVSYNIPMCNIFEREVKRMGLIPLFHSKVPNGDGGISCGQIYIGNFKV